MTSLDVAKSKVMANRRDYLA